MTTSTAANKLAWYDRWSTPSVQALIDAIKHPHRKHFINMKQRVEGLGQVSSSLIWYGASWKWSLQFTVTLPKSNGKKKNGTNGSSTPVPPLTIPGPMADQESVLCYLVPDVNKPLICIPMSTQFIDVLPEKRLRKFIRDGIHTAKCAVEIHWATWSPNSDEEIDFLMDLAKRKYQFMVRPPAPAVATSN